MKPCTRFHFEDVERGDVLALQRDIEEDATFKITVARAYSTHNFGPVIEAIDGESYYLVDYDSVKGDWMTESCETITGVDPNDKPITCEQPGIRIGAVVKCPQCWRTTRARSDRIRKKGD